MKQFDSGRVRLVHWFSLRFLLAIALLIPLCGTAMAAQQQQPAPKKRVPTLTTEDVARPQKETVISEPAAKPDAKAPAGAKTEPLVADQKSQQPETKVNADEVAWRQRVKEARARADHAERSAEEAEVRTTELRNQLNVSGQTPKARNQLAAELDEAGRRLAALRQQEREAKTELNNVLDEGREKGFSEEPGLQPVADGKPNEQYYVERYAKLRQLLQDSERRITLYENRVRSIGEAMSNPNKDRFTSDRLRQDYDEAKSSLEAARAGRAKALADIEALMDEARRAGLSPGIFR